MSIKQKMRRRIILKLFRLYLIIDKKSEKFTLIHYLIIVAISAILTANVKRLVKERFSDRNPAGYIIYDYV